MILGLDTSSSLGSVALARGETVLGSRAFEADHGHSRQLLPAIEGLLTELGLDVRGVDRFAIVRGPGSFTGLRVSLACLRGLAEDRPCFGALAPEVAAWAGRGHGGTILAVTDLFHGEVFGGVYDPEGRLLSGHESGGIDTVLASLRPWIDERSVAIGSAALKHRAAIETAFGPLAFLELDQGLAIPLIALALAQGGVAPPQRAHEILPFYLRDPLTRGLLNRRPKAG